MKKYPYKQLKDFIDRIQITSNSNEDKRKHLPKISIVTPSFNQGEYLERTILSVINQNYPNIEYIIIDGGSTDNSLSIIKKYEKFLSYWVSEKDKGQSDALNKGFAKATGDIFFYLASDDILMPDVLNKVANIFIKYNPDVVYGNRLIIDPYDNVISERRCVTYVPCLSRLGILTLGSFAVYPDSMFYKREIFEKVGGFDLRLHNTMDTDFWLKVTKITKKIRFFREYIIGFRVTPTSKTVAFWNDIRERETKELMKRHGRPPFAKLIGVVPYVFYLFVFILQGDLDYIIKRIFVEKRRKYFEYFR